MKDRNRFVLAVIVALVIPLIFGGLYFYDMSSKRGSNGHIAKFENVKELLVFGDKEIRNIGGNVLRDDQYEQANKIEFEVDYASGLNACTAYSISASIFKRYKDTFPENVSWRLLKFEEKMNDYKTVAMGNFESVDGIVQLGPSQELCLMEEAKYRLYYYLNNETNVDGLVFKLSIE